ncbi:MAG: Xanthine dehydrogenase iron-sulfur subunit [Acidobacteria bacterium]|jgi:carbon-monoxide dehydrogenase small subunit|nr:Xanthine dehydrogenase iron-sulfur subunit [Acidobacteriota bacterium]
MNLEFVLNGSRRIVEADPGESLMDLLRRLGLKSVKNGCDDGYCGACAVLLDGRAVNACLVFAARAAGCRVDTVEGLTREGALHPLQQAVLDLGAAQCGFCTPGIVMTALDLLMHHPRPDEREVREALAGNYCRCTGYVKPVEAILAAAAQMREAPE